MIQRPPARLRIQLPGRRTTLAGAFVLTLLLVLRTEARSGGWELLVGYVLAALCLLPASPLDIAFGARFGLGWGVAGAHLSATLSAGLVFLVSRHLLREHLPGFLCRDRRFRGLRAMVGRRGWPSVFLARLSPGLPFSALSWLFGATRVPFGQHLSATFLATLPKTIVYVSIGAAAGGWVEPDSGAPAGATVVLASESPLALSAPMLAAGDRLRAAGSLEWGP